MKTLKMFLATFVLFGGPLMALDVGDQIKATILDHAVIANQFAEGKSRVVLLDSIILIGSHKGRSILDLQGGIAGDARPEEGQQGIKWIAGGFFKVSTLVRDVVKFADQYRFLNSLEYGAFANYDFTEKDWLYGAQVGLAFGLSPVS